MKKLIALLLSLVLVLGLVTKWIVTAPNDEGTAGAYIAKEEFKKEYSCFKAAAYFSATVTGNVEGQAGMDFLNNGTEIFGDYHGTIPGDEAYGIYPLGGIMVDPTNYVDVMGPDAE